MEWKKLRCHIKKKTTKQCEQWSFGEVRQTRETKTSEDQTMGRRKRERRTKRIISGGSFHRHGLPVVM